MDLSEEKVRLRLAGAGAFAFLRISFWVLLLQALLLAHGGLTTLGANWFTMGLAGPCF